MKWQLTVSGGTYQGLPLSGEAVRRFLRDLATGIPEESALERLMRWSFPLRWRWLWLGDPVRQLLRDPLRAVKLAAFLAIPAEPTEPRVLDEWDRARAANRDPVVEDAGPRVTLDRVCRLVEAQMGAGWYWNPARWDTRDGYAPYDAVYAAWATLQMTRALDRMDLTRSALVANAGDRAQGFMESDAREALGG